MRTTTFCMSDRDELQLTVMIRALEAVAAYIADLDEAGFIADRLKIDAVAMNLLVTGEAANKLSEPLRAQIPAPWTEVVALRHRLAHDYFGMRIDRLWMTASESAPDLLKLVTAWLERR